MKPSERIASCLEGARDSELVATSLYFYVCNVFSLASTKLLILAFSSFGAITWQAILGDQARAGCLLALLVMAKLGQGC